MGNNIAHTSTDFRLLDCKHDRLRQALQFRPAGAEVAAPVVVAPAPALPVDRSLEVTADRTSPTEFLAGAVSTLVLGVVWCLLVCTTDVMPSSQQNASTSPQVQSQVVANPS